MFFLADKNLAQLGDFIFAVQTLSFDSLKRSATYRWSELKRLGRKPALQWEGEGLDTISLTGVIYPHFKGGLLEIKKLKEMAATGLPYPLIYTDTKKAEASGLWCITAIKESRELFISGGAPLKITFEIELKEYGKDL